jgi:hypothetical protein
VIGASVAGPEYRPGAAEWLRVERLAPQRGGPRSLARRGAHAILLPPLSFPRARPLHPPSGARRVLGVLHRACEWRLPRASHARGAVTGAGRPPSVLRIRVGHRPSIHRLHPCPPAAADGTSRRFHRPRSLTCEGGCFRM